MLSNAGYIFVLTICLFCLVCNSANVHDQSCGEGKTLGTCTILSKCSSALNQIQQEQTHHLERCGFEGNNEYVCCPDFKNVRPQENKTTPELSPHSGVWAVIPIVTREGSSGERKSLAACKQYIASYPVSIGYYIIGGENATLGEFPHMAQIGFASTDFRSNYTWECGGSLISSRFVLTAAHCIVKVNGIPPSIVRVGFVDSDFPNNTVAQVRGVKNFTVHEGYSRRSKQNDIGLVELDAEVEFTTLAYPACLYQASDNPTGLIITGWGNTIARGEAPSRVLQKANIEPVQLNECSRLLQARTSISITTNHICCASPKNTSADTCQGDSGGPVQKLRQKTVYSIVGVTSFGQGCGGVAPGIYTRVSSYLDWIEKIVWP